MAGAFATAAFAGGPAQDYTLYCMGCHGAEAQGVPGKIPPLAGTLGRFMRTPEGRNYVLRVPGAANSALTDGQLAGVLNWLAERYAVDEVARVRRTPLANVQAVRREVLRGLAASGVAPAADY
jgi:mono/diheme cytochrome c family protein